MPLIVSGPHVGLPGSTSDALVHVVDILPTVADIAGIPLGGDEGGFIDWGLDDTLLVDGRSLLPHLSDPLQTGRQSIYAEGFSPNGGPASYSLDRRALREAEWKLVRRGAVEELYRLEPDTELDVVDVLVGATLDLEALAAYDRLATEMDRLELTVVHEGF